MSSRCREDALPHHEAVIRGGFSDIPAAVQHESLIGPETIGFHLAEDIVQVVEALDLGGQRIGTVAAGGYGDDFQSLLVLLRGIELNSAGNNINAGTFGAVARIDAQISGSP